MAAAPVKQQQQPLHNFSLPHHLKWAHKNSRRRHSSPDHPPPPSDPWNLRPKKKEASSSKKQTLLDNNNHLEKSSDLVDGVVVKSKSQRLRGFLEGIEKKEMKKKRRIWVSLSKEEIEEDVFAITGSKPSRRPRKWPKNVQKQLDGLFPGLYLVGVTAEMYHDHDATKGN